jgi:hypothetical protein
VRLAALGQRPAMLLADDVFDVLLLLLLVVMVSYPAACLCVSAGG